MTRPPAPRATPKSRRPTPAGRRLSCPGRAATRWRAWAPRGCCSRSQPARRRRRCRTASGSTPTRRASCASRAGRPSCGATALVATGSEALQGLGRGLRVISRDSRCTMDDTWAMVLLAAVRSVFCRICVLVLLWCCPDIALSLLCSACRCMMICSRAKLLSCWMGGRRRDTVTVVP